MKQLFRAEFSYPQATSWHQFVALEETVCASEQSPIQHARDPGSVCTHAPNPKKPSLRGTGP